jgi:glycosyltransferase involved in cell wall biosynthesis
MWNNQSVSVILPTYNEKDSIRSCIEGFQQTGLVDEIIVVNNNAAAGTSEEVRGTSAREVHESVQGYGAAIQRGFLESKGDLIVVCEPDATFLPRDLLKLLSYSIDFDFVLGTRTAKEFIWSGANMDFALRWGNYAVAKMLEFLFNTTTLSDVGCTYRLIKREALAAMQPLFRVKGNFFGPEMMLLAAVKRVAMVQIPVNYCPRVGSSSVTGDRVKAIKLGFRMIWLILEFRLNTWFKADYCATR